MVCTGRVFTLKWGVTKLNCTVLCVVSFSKLSFVEVALSNLHLITTIAGGLRRRVYWTADLSVMLHWQVGWHFETDRVKRLNNSTAKVHSKFYFMHWKMNWAIKVHIKYKEISKEFKINIKIMCSSLPVNYLSILQADVNRALLPIECLFGYSFDKLR